LSGGINPSNVAAIRVLKGMNLYAIDVNSGAGSSPGVKDMKLINELIREFKRIVI
jgi:phosphoribosylanthranilate isomerase